MAAAVTFAHVMTAAPRVQAIDRPVLGRVSAGEVVLTAATADGEQMTRLEAAVHDAVATTHLLVVAARAARIDLADVLSTGRPGKGAPVSETTVARLWIDAAGGSPATLYLTDGERRRVYVRRVPLESGLLDRVALESIAFIVESSVSALVAGREIGVSREAFAQSMVAVPALPITTTGAGTPATPRPSPVAPSYPRWASLVAAYEIVRAAPVPYQHRIVIEYRSSWRRARVGMAAYAAAPQRISGPLVGARLLTTGANLTAGAHWPTGGTFDLSAGAGLGIEATRVDPVVSTAMLRATPPLWSSALSMRGFGLVERALTPLGARWVVGLLVGVEVHPSPERYLISAGPGSQVALQTPRWRPVAGVLIGTRM